MAPGPRIRREDVQERVEGVLRRFEHTVPVRLFRLFVAIDGRDRILMLAGQAFIAVIPLLIVVATLTGVGGTTSVGSYLVRRFELEGSAESSVRLLFVRPPVATGGISLVSLVVLLWTINSFARSLQRTFAAAWGLPRVSRMATVHRLSGLVVLMLVLSGASWIGRLFGEGVVPTVLAIIAQPTAIVLGWAVATHLMLSRRVPVRVLLPGALASTAIQLVVGWGTAIYVPDLVARNADNYGVIGAALALVSWLIVVSASIVASAVVGNVLARGGPYAEQVPRDL